MVETKESGAFVLCGEYRVQSKGGGRPSRLVGTWLASDCDEPSDGVNQVLRTDPDWRGKETVRIRGAIVEARLGEFAAEPDVLYKRSHFLPQTGSDAMDFDVVDVLKAAAQWGERSPFAVALFGRTSYFEIVQCIGDIAEIAAYEYYAHEFGHSLGYATAAKYRDGYFRVGGKTLWPLVYVEEFRADLLGFEFAAKNWSPETARAVFLYNLALRFGVHAQGIKQLKMSPYGPIPLFLYSQLRELGAIQPKGRGFAITDLSTNQLKGVLLQLGSVARKDLVESRTEHPTTAALRAAAFYRSMMDRRALVQEYEHVFDQFRL